MTRAGHSARSPDHWWTAAAPARSEVRQRGSRFVASLAPASDPAAADAFAASVARELFHATHHCRAQRVLLPDADRPLELASDAGEPPGTAGRPILLALSGAGLVNCVLVVSRWFGGTKLGRGGLARAYGLAARAAVDAATLAPVRRMRRVEVCAPFGDAGLVAAVAARAGARVEALEPEAVYRAMLLVPEERWSELVGALANATGGRASAMPGERVLGLGEPGDPAGRLTPPRRRGKLGA